MNAIYDVLTFQEESVLDLLKSHVQSQKDAIDALQRKAQYNFTIVNIIAAIVAGLNFDYQWSAERPGGAVLGVVIVLAMLALYFVIALLSIRALWVKRQYTFPMQPTAENVANWTNCGAEHHKTVLRDSYLLIFRRNARILRSKGNMVLWSHRLIIVSLLLLLLFAVLGILPGMISAVS